MTSRHKQVSRPTNTFELNTYNQFVSSLKPYLWYKFNETSGTSVINYGTSGSGFNGTFTPGLGSVNNIGQFGLSSAYSFDGLDTKIAVSNNPAYANSTKQTVIALINPTNSGEGTNGAIYCFSNGNNRWLYASSTLFFGRRVTGSTNAQTTTNSGQVPINGEWQLAIFKYNDTTDRKVKLYKGYKGQLTEYTYGTQTAATGSLGNETGVLNIGNATTPNLSFSGLFGNFIWINDDIPLSVLLKLTRLAKV